MGTPSEVRPMRTVVIRSAPIEPEDAERRERLVELLATGLERLFAQSLEQDSPPHSVDYSESLLPTTNTPEGEPSGADLS
jgi:hypothetical protein